MWFCRHANERLEGVKFQESIFSCPVESEVSVATEFQGN